jgi:hypothetical protein
VEWLAIAAIIAILVVWYVLSRAAPAREHSPKVAPRITRRAQSPKPAPASPEPPRRVRDAAVARLDANNLTRNIAYLRHVLGDTWNGVLDPFTADSQNAVAVNHAVNRLAAHVGLTGTRFIVGIGPLPPARAGTVELGASGDDVFIEVSPVAATFGPSFIAVLAHEVIHKVLFERGIRHERADTASYEVLTDIAAVYLGFGKLLLNGYEYATTRHDPSTRTIHKRSIRFGYVSAEAVAFTHVFICAMRRHAVVDWYAGLSPYATRILAAIHDDRILGHVIAGAPYLAPSPSFGKFDQRAATAAPEAPRRTDAPRPVRAPRQAAPTSTHPPRTSPELARLRNDLLALVYGDERLVDRLVAFERPRHSTEEARYRAAIMRLERDRR